MLTIAYKSAENVQKQRALEVSERRLQNDGFLLSQISSVVVDTQKACRQAAAARQSRVSQVGSPSDSSKSLLPFWEILP